MLLRFIDMQASQTNNNRTWNTWNVYVFDFIMSSNKQTQRQIPTNKLYRPKSIDLFSQRIIREWYVK